MEQVPNIVRERLKMAPAAVNHPDADILTAFSERCLPDLEREIVLEHLALCGECREVLALSLPANEAIQPARETSTRSWLAWPALRWGFAAAGILLVGSIGILQYRKQTHSSSMAYRAPGPSVSEDEATKRLSSPEPAAEPATQSESESGTETDALKAEIPKSQKKFPSPAGRDEAVSAPLAPPSRPVFSRGPRMTNQQLNTNLQQQNAITNQSAQQLVAPTASPKQQQPNLDLTAKRVAPASQAIEVAGAAPPVNAQAEDRQSLTVQSQSLDQQQLRGGLSESKVDTTSAPVVGYAAAAKVPGPARRAGSGMGAGIGTANARWAITSSGALQRSTDQGNSWQDVNVTDNSSAAPASMMLTAKAKKLDDKDTENDKIERSKALPIVFRAVSANGPDVWAGGSAGTLYHSVDAGAHWIRVIPATEVSTLTGEILTVTFTDPQHGRITTSTSEVWITANAGLTWQKQ